MRVLVRRPIFRFLGAARESVLLAFSTSSSAAVMLDAAEQALGVGIGLAGLLLIVVMATGAAIGSPGTPGVGIVVRATILSSVGIPSAGIAIVLGSTGSWTCAAPPSASPATWLPA